MIIWFPYLEKSTELRDYSMEHPSVAELTYPDSLPDWSFFESVATDGEEKLSEEDRKTLEELILNPTITEEHFLNVTVRGLRYGI